MPDPIRLGALNHIARVTARLAESRAFYTNVLGFREMPRPNFDFPGAWLKHDSLTIHLIGTGVESELEGPINTRGNHIAFETPDMAAAEELLRSHGVEFRSNWQANSDIQQLFLRDPDGHHIEIASYRPDPARKATAL